MTGDGCPSGKPRLGVSTCLLGEHVRYDGGHKRDPFLVDTLGGFVEWVPVCPEVECGLGVPREAMRLVGDPQNPRLVTRNTGIDQTDRMQSWIAKRLAELERDGLDGFVLKARSPSCGMRDVGVFDVNGDARGVGVGLWANALTERFPGLPIVEEEDLRDARGREDFLKRVFLRARRRGGAAEADQP